MTVYCLGGCEAGGGLVGVKDCDAPEDVCKEDTVVVPVRRPCDTELTELGLDGRGASPRTSDHRATGDPVLLGLVPGSAKDVTSSLLDAPTAGTGAAGATTFGIIGSLRSKVL